MRNHRYDGILITDLHGDRREIPRSTLHLVLAQEGGEGELQRTLASQWVMLFIANETKGTTLVRTSGYPTKHTNKSHPELKTVNHR